MQKRVLTQELIQSYFKMLQTRYSKSTKERYQRDVADFFQYTKGREINVEICSRYEEELRSRYSARSIQTILNGLNTFFRFADWNELEISISKLQAAEKPDKEAMTLEEYDRLLEEAKKNGDQRLWLLMQTLYMLHLRVSEHPFVTRKALAEGYFILARKESRWIVYLPRDLKMRLEGYCQCEQITDGPVFRTSNGRVYDRSNIYRDMKRLCPGSGVQDHKVTPQQLLNLGYAGPVTRIKLKRI